LITRRTYHKATLVVIIKFWTLKFLVHSTERKYFAIFGNVKIWTLSKPSEPISSKYLIFVRTISPNGTKMTHAMLKSLRNWGTTKMELSHHKWKFTQKCIPWRINIYSAHVFKSWDNHYQFNYHHSRIVKIRRLRDCMVNNRLPQKSPCSKAPRILKLYFYMSLNCLKAGKMGENLYCYRKKVNLLDLISKWSYSTQSNLVKSFAVL